MNDWELEDVENTCKTNLNTFFIPALDERISQKKGDEVRLHFLLIDPKKDDR